MSLDIDVGAGVFRALGDESRLRILLSLLDRELCVCQIVNLLDLAESTISRHLQVLKEAGLIEANKRGRWIYYRPSTKADAEAIHRLMRPVLEAIAGSRQASADSEKLKHLLEVDPEELRQRMHARV